MTATVGQMIEWAAHNYPHKTGLVYEEKDQRWTFAELDAKVNQFAIALRTLGVCKGDVVSTFLYNTSEFVIALFASAKIGAVFNPINYRLSANELLFILNDCHSKVLLYEGRVKDCVEKVKHLGSNVKHFIYVDHDTPEDTLNFYNILDSSPTDRPQEYVSEDDPYIMMYTSGTTGKPKGVVHVHKSMVHHNLLMMQCMGINKNDVGLSVAPLNHTAELHTSFLPRLQAGATNVLLPYFNAEKVLATIEKENVTHIFAAPTMVNMMLNVPNFEMYDLSTLRLLGYGGASMAPALIRKFQQMVGAELVQMYGTTEMGPVMSVMFSDEHETKAGSAGKTILNHELKIVRVKSDESPAHPDDECEVGEVGEIIVRGPCVMKGYHNRPEANEQALAYGWYHTGDLAEYDEEGYIWIRDRMNHKIVSGAENIYPREVEDALIEHPAVLEVAVVGKPDDKWGEIVVAFVVLKDGSQVSEEQLDQFLIDGEKLAKFKRPRQYYFVHELPKTASGKIQKFVLVNKFKVEEKA
ncbi:fatty-acyl-CoA synthase [Caldalkalibacillus uzonensis]|uniref:Fatty-acyl-CoA synthase n=1 Tax=Caldalkalibacillus uzonensis TaxID=353224 RepID=A0ABU0CTR0_9BACI|nr:long-chain-fatty-acid--CoA ligase [Caldalkalibacillus uzonensis]MDQ0338895.1 fatty-acyl-CoA synthase [Caldalkalibacillus uzonensis]